MEETYYKGVLKMRFSKALNEDMTRDLSLFKSVYDSVIGLASEVGELGDIVRKLEGGKVTKPTDDLSNMTVKLEDELADVLVYLFQIATHYNVDIECAFKNKVNKIYTRMRDKHPEVYEKKYPPLVRRGCVDTLRSYGAYRVVDENGLTDYEDYR